MEIVSSEPIAVTVYESDIGEFSSFTSTIFAAKLMGTLKFTVPSFERRATVAEPSISIPFISCEFLQASEYRSKSVLPHPVRENSIATTRIAIKENFFISFLLEIFLYSHYTTKK